MTNIDTLLPGFPLMWLILWAGISVFAASRHAPWGLATVALFLVVYALLKVIGMELVMFWVQVSRRDEPPPYERGT